MSKEQFHKTLISILIGTAIMTLNQVVGLLLELLKTHQNIIIPAVTGMVHYLSPWKTNPTA